MKVVALVPAHNEQASIAATIQALLAQSRVPDRIIVLSDNSTDNTLKAAQRFPWPVTAIATQDNKHKKSGALNYGWRTYCQDADVVICLDADTVLPPNAIGDWEQELESTPELGGSSSKFTMQAPDFLSRLQKAEFARWTDTALRKGWTSVLAGTGCAIRNSVLFGIVDADDRDGPWSYHSQTEDFELTYQIRSRGFKCHVSPTVRAYTDSMKTIKALWGQRVKWQVGTVEDLLSTGINKWNYRDWWGQFLGVLSVVSRLLWAFFVVLALAVTHQFHWTPICYVLPFLFMANSLKQAFRIPHWDWKDIAIAMAFIPEELFIWMRCTWFVYSWCAVIKSKITGNRKDRWQMQYQSEGMYNNV